MLHEMRDQRGAMSGVAAAHRVHSHAEITQAVAQAFAGMACGRPRPVYLEIPLDLLTDTASDVSIVEPITVSPREPAGGHIEVAADRLAGAEWPGILLGGGAKRAAAEARHVAEALAAPVLTTINGKGILPEDHPLAVSAALHLPGASRFVQQCDVLLAAGTEFAETDWWSGVPRPGWLIRVDIDLAQLVVNAQPDLAIHADSRAALRAIAAALGSDLSGANQSRAVEWRERLRGQARTEGARWVSTMDAVASVVDRDAVVVADYAMASYYGAVGNLPVHTPGGFCFPTGFGTLGYAVPAALGVSVAHPGRQVVALAGDGGLMFSMPELASVAAEGIALPIVVFVNGGYGEIRAQMHAAGMAPLGVELPSPDWMSLARSLGGDGVRCQTPATLADELRIALRRPGPTLLVVDEGAP
jgi:thiamine pyrophosphate-dependent acetolactate synthase large subunit-like protein